MSEKITILYVDDEPINLMLFEENFNQNYEIITAESGIDGLNKLRKYPDIKVAISDMKMPEMNGIEFIEQAKKEFPNITFFIFTGYNLTDEIADALNKQLIKKYFCKPFDEHEIEKAIQGALK
jgi:two-component system, response regulator, stage 0 sporulation protein F